MPDQDAIAPPSQQDPAAVPPQNPAAAPPQKFRTQNVFATPLVTSRFGNQRLLDALEQVIQKRREEDPGITRSNRGGWHSDIKILEWGGDAARLLARQVVEFANANTMRSDDPNASLRWRVEGWANINQQGASNARHIHGGCYWSAVYYVRVPEGKGGDLVFYDPRMPGIAMHAPRLRFRMQGGERLIRIKPKPSMLLVFPAWLDHEVDSWEGDGERISIALNLLAAPDVFEAPKKPASDDQPALPAS